jgi:hypothetical protein
VPLHDAIARVGGFRISGGFVSPLDLASSATQLPQIALIHVVQLVDRHRRQIAEFWAAADELRACLQVRAEPSPLGSGN